MQNADSRMAIVFKLHPKCYIQHLGCIVYGKQRDAKLH